MKKYFLKFIERTMAGYAKQVLAKHKPFIVGVTGSVGKTSTKEAIYQVLAGNFGDEVRATAGNLNNEIGVPLTILGYKKAPNVLFWPIFLVLAKFKTREEKYPKYLVLEFGIDKPDDMDYFADILQLDMAVITLLEPAHLANFASADQYYAEKLKITKMLKEDGKIVANFDDDVLAQKLADKAVSVGILNKKAIYKGENITVSEKGTEYRIETVGQKISVVSKLLGNQLVYSQLIAFAVGQLMGIQSLRIKKSLEKIERVPGRANLISGKNGMTIIDDTYNSNPTSMKAALNLLADFKTKNRKVAIIGNMNELGKYEKAAHREIGSYASGKCDLAIFVGPNAKVMAKEFDNKTSSYIFENRRQLEGGIFDIVHRNDVVLIKASQNNNFFEELVKKLMLEPEKASTLLVRQGAGWRGKK